MTTAMNTVENVVTGTATIIGAAIRATDTARKGIAHIRKVAADTAAGLVGVDVLNKVLDEVKAEQDNAREAISKLTSSMRPNNETRMEYAIPEGLHGGEIAAALLSTVHGEKKKMNQVAKGMLSSLNR